MSTELKSELANIICQQRWSHNLPILYVNRAEVRIGQ